MNCYEWRKHITGSVSVTVNYNEATEAYTASGSGTVTHGALYSGWTHRELQCLGAPLAYQPDWILRGDNLCEGRAQLVGVLTQANTIAVTITPTGGDPYVEDRPIYFKLPADDYSVTEGMLPLSPYPNWENDPYSVATRAQIDALTQDFLRVGLGTGSPGFPAANEVSLRWLKDGLTGTSEDGTLTVTLGVNFTLA